MQYSIFTFKLFLYNNISVIIIFLYKKNTMEKQRIFRNKFGLIWSLRTFSNDLFTIYF
jgi:hypothetical protein